MSEPTAGTKLCPFCAEEVKSAAIKCKHCGEMLDSGSASKPVKAPSITDAAPPGRVLLDEDDITVTENTITFGGVVYQISTLSTVKVRNIGPGCGVLLAGVILTLFSLLSVLSLGAEESDVRLFWFLVLLGCVAGFIWLFTTKPPSIWQVYTKIGLDEKMLYQGTDESKARAAHAAILKALEK
jgi:hypothetical protein